MRVRLLIDVLWPDEKVMELGEKATRQPAVRVTIDDDADFGDFRNPTQTGRLMGVQPVNDNHGGT